jgi:hypothetical protein
MRRRGEEGVGGEEGRGGGGRKVTSYRKNCEVNSFFKPNFLKNYVF